jgi:hypothetical protein
MVLAVPWHIVEADGVGVEGVPTVGVTFMVIELDEAGFPVAQVAFDVSTQVIISLFAGTYA